MSIKPYCYYNDAIFNKPAMPIDATVSDEKLLSIMQDLYDTHFQSPDKVGVGLAANQIGYRYCVFMTYISEEIAQAKNIEPRPVEFWMNARYQALGDETCLGQEGCYSVPAVFGRYVKRFCAVTVNAEKLEFELSPEKQLSITAKKPALLKLTDLHARIFQHEIDHLDPVRPRFYFEYVEGGIEALEPIENRSINDNKK